MTEQPHTPNTDDIGARARTAVGWRALSQFSSQGISIVTGIILARLLMPADFGIIGMAGIVTGLAGVFQDLGFGQALVQRAQLRPEHSRSAFWMTLIMGGLLYAALYLGAPFAGGYFHDERMVPVLRLMALSFLISPFGMVPRSLLQRELDFRRPFWAGLAGTITSGAVGITLALLGHGYWSLVWALLASSVVGTIALCIVTRYTPPLVPTLRGARALVAFGGGITSIHLVGYFAKQTERFVIGRYLDAYAMGIYTRAYGLVETPFALTVFATGPIAFSALARLQGQPERLHAAYLRILGAVCMVTLPSVAVLLVAAPEFVPVVFGRHWVDAVRPIQWLSLATVGWSIGSVATNARKAVGRVGMELGLQITLVALTLSAALLGYRYGVVGVAAAVAIAHNAALIPHVYLARRAFGVSAAAHAGAVLAPTGVALACLLSALAARELCGVWGMGEAGTLAIVMGTGVCVVAVMLLWVPWPGIRSSREELSRIVPSHWRARRV